jgi:hypothetical protein
VAGGYVCRCVVSRISIGLKICCIGNGGTTGEFVCISQIIYQVIIHLHRLTEKIGQPLINLSWLLFGFYPCEVLEIVVISMTSSRSSKMDFVRNSYCVFGVWRFYRFIFIAKSNLLPFGFILLCWTMMFLWMKLSFEYF